MELPNLKIIVGLGNVGSDYLSTRHNIGFMIIDQLAGKHQAHWSEKTKFKALMAEIQVDGQKTLLIKPATFYNLSGEAVRQIKNFYKISNQDILVIHDELALPFGTIRARIDGSDAGNNGVKSITSHIGPDYARIRVGISNEFAKSSDAAEFVLGRFNNSELDTLPNIYAEANNLIGSFISQNKKFEHTSVRIG